MSAPTLEVKTAITRYGLMHYYSDDTYIGLSLEKYGEYSEAEPAFWRKFIKPGDSVVDIGANIGSLTLALSQIVGDTGRVLAVEAQPENFELLKRNAELSPQDNIFTINAPLGDKRGKIKIPTLADLMHKNYGAVELKQGDHEVDLFMFDELCGDRRVDFIKIDVEGMEAEVLRGAHNTIRRFRPILYVENDRPAKSDELLRLLDEMGYRVFEHRPLLYSKDNYNDAPVLEQAIISINVLCLPRERADEFADITMDLLHPPQPNPKRLIQANKHWACIVRLGGIGDDLIASSVLRPLKKQGYMTEVITQEPQSVVFENNPYLDKLTVKAPRELPQDIGEWQKHWWAKSGEYKKFVNLSHSVEALMARFQSDSAFWWPPSYRRVFCGRPYLEVAHDIVEVPHDFGPLFFPTDEEKGSIDLFRQRHKLMDKPLVAWVIGGTRVDKVYSNAGAAIARLLAEVDVNVIMMCAPAPQYRDRSYAEQIMNSIMITNSSTRGLSEARDIPGSHDWPIRRMLTLATSADLVIGPDSGIMWAVAFEPMPKIVLHSHASVDNITKHWLNTVSLHADQKRVPCSPCHLLHDGVETCMEMQMRAGLKPTKDDLGAACIHDIPVQLVLEAARAALDGDSAVLEALRGSFPAQVTLR